MKWNLRREMPADYREVEYITREAFWNEHGPGCSEHYLAHAMREHKDFISELDFVALDGDKIIGNIMYTKCYIVKDNTAKFEVLCYGPISVLPEYQSKGVGCQLIEHTKKLAKEIGYEAILIYGDPEYYKRVGFVGAKKYSIGTEYNTYSDALLACELVPGVLNDKAGLFYESPIYNVDEQAAEIFDESFPKKEKLTGLPSQQRFIELSTSGKPRVI